MRRLLPTALLATLLLAAPAAARTWPAGTTVLADGVDSLLVVEPGAAPRIVRDDEPLSGGTAVPLPGGCTVGGFSTAYVAVSCGDAPIQLFDRSTAAWGPLPGEGAIRAHAWVRAVMAVGREAITVSVDSGRSGAADVPYAIATGRRGDLDPGPREYATLDSPTAVAPLCAPVRTRTRREKDVEFGVRVTVRQHARMAGDWAVRFFDSGPLELQRCGSARTVALGRRARTAPVLTGGYLAWAGPRRVHLRWHATGRTERRRSPSGVDVSLAGTERRLVLRVDGRVRTIDVRS